MSILHVPHYSHNDLHGSIRLGLEKALHAMAAALTAVKPVANVSQAAVAAPKQRDVRALLNMANRHEALSPSLAAELRCIARQ